MGRQGHQTHGKDDWFSRHSNCHAEFPPVLLDEIADEGQTSEMDAGSYTFMPLGRKGLPDSTAKCRPCWEPPIAAYTEYEEALQAHKTTCEREGNANVTWRTHA